MPQDETMLGKDWKELAALASQEADSEKLKHIIDALCQALDAREDGKFRKETRSRSDVKNAESQGPCCI